MTIQADTNIINYMNKTIQKLDIAMDALYQSIRHDSKATKALERINRLIGEIEKELKA